MHGLGHLLGLKLVGAVSSSVHGLEKGEHLALVALLDDHRLVHLAASSHALPSVLLNFFLGQSCQLVELEVSRTLVQKPALGVSQVIYEPSFHGKLLGWGMGLLFKNSGNLAVSSRSACRL